MTPLSTSVPADKRHLVGGRCATCGTRSHRLLRRRETWSEHRRRGRPSWTTCANCEPLDPLPPSLAADVEEVISGAPGPFDCVYDDVDSLGPYDGFDLDHSRLLSPAVRYLADLRSRAC